MQKFSSESRTLALVHYNLCTFSPMSYELFCDFSSNHMCRSWALDFLVRLFVLIACVAHGCSNGMCQPWALNFLVGFMFYITFAPMGYDISRENLVLIACVAHELWAFGVILVLIACVAH